MEKETLYGKKYLHYIGIQQGCDVIVMINNWYKRAQTDVNIAIHGQVVFEHCIRKQTAQPWRTSLWIEFIPDLWFSSHFQAFFCFHILIFLRGGL